MEGADANAGGAEQAPATVAMGSVGDERYQTDAAPSAMKTSANRYSKSGAKKPPIPPPPRATPSSSSGYPGVSWNKRMGAWLSFYYDADTRRSRTFHPKYYDFDVEKAKQAAIEFMKSIEKHPRCSLRKSRRDNKSSSSYAHQTYEVDKTHGVDLPSRNRKRSAPCQMVGMECKQRSTKQAMACPPSQPAAPEPYDLEIFKRQFHISSNLLEPCYMTNPSSLESDYMGPQGAIHETNYLSGSLESQHDYDKFYPNTSNWPTIKKIYNQDYYIDNQKYGMPFLEGDVVYPSPNSSIYNDNDIMLSCSCGHSRQQLASQQAHSHLSPPKIYSENQDIANNQGVFVGTHYDVSPQHEDAEIHMLMQSIGLSPNDSLEGFRFNTYNYGDGTANYGRGPPNIISNGNTTPLGSPYLSPYVHSVYKQSSEENDLNRSFGFQSLILATDPKQGTQTTQLLNSQG